MPCDYTGGTFLSFFTAARRCLEKLEVWVRLELVVVESGNKVELLVKLV